jgi:hypothetical protein
MGKYTTIPMVWISQTMTPQGIKGIASRVKLKEGGISDAVLLVHDERGQTIHSIPCAITT